MKVSGTATLHAPAERVFAALNDPSVLVRTLPGCEQLEAVDGERYRMTITAGVASIKGTYLGDVVLTDPVPPSAFTLRASGSGAPGTVSADVRVTLDDRGDGTTLLRYDADAVVGGPVGGVGQRVLIGVARRTAGEFFHAIDAVLTGTVDASVGGTAPRDGGETAPREVVPAAGRLPAQRPAPGAGQVFRRPPAPSRSGVRAVATAPGILAGQLPGVLIGATIALLGVLVGWRLGRRSTGRPRGGH